MGGALLLLAGLAPLLYSDLPPEVLYLSRLQTFYRDRFEVLARQSCLVRIDRFERPNAKHDFYTKDSLAFDVSIIGGREYYGWPGAKRLDLDDPAMIVRTGLLSTGELGLHLKSILISRGPTTRHKSGSCYEFDVPEMLSGYNVSNESMNVLTAYSGEFCGAGDGEPRLRSLRIRTAELPPQSRMRFVTLEWSFGESTQSELDGILPLSSKTRVIHWSGHELENRSTYSHCRPLEVETKLSFDLPNSIEPGVPFEQPSRKWLPPGVLLPISFEAASRKGAKVEGRITRDVIHERALLIPAGSLVRARSVPGIRGGVVVEEVETPAGTYFIHAERGRPGQWRTVPFPIR